MASQQLHTLEPGEELLKITHINKFLIIVTNYDRYIYYYDSENNEYNELDRLPLLDFDTSSTAEIGNFTVGTDFPTAKAYMIGELPDLWTQGKMEGHCLFRCAWKLTDGSYIDYSKIHYKYFGSLVSSEEAYMYISGVFLIQHQLTESHKMEFYVTAAQKATLLGYDGLVTSLCIFVTNPVSQYKYTEGEAYTDWEDMGAGVYKPTANSDNISLLPQQQNYYKIAEVSYNDFAELSGYTLEVDIDFSVLPILETKETLPDWQSPHHIWGEAAKLYNSRLHFANCKTKLFDGYSPAKYLNTTDNGSRVNTTQYKYYIFYYLKTDNGEIIRRKSFTGWTDDPGSEATAVYIENLLLYPDIRCYKMAIYKTTNDGVTKYACKQEGELFMFNMSPHPFLNFAYHFTTIASCYINNQAVATLPTENTGEKIVITDPNRIQVSELDNPLVYPPINSYQIGEDDDYEILGFGVLSEPVSEGQFGEFPLYIFTAKGIFTAQLGSGDVLYASIQLLNREVCNNADSILDLGGSIAYTTDEGLRIVSGREVKEISTPLEGSIYNGVFASAYSDELSEGIDLYDNISTVDFLEYIASAILAYDKVNNEIIVTNPSVSVSYDYNYSYVYQIDYDFWYKTDIVYDQFIHDYPDVKAIRQTTEYNITEEEDDYQTVLIQTRPFKLDTSNIKKIKGLKIEGVMTLKENKYATLTLFGSNNCKEWYPISSSQMRNVDIYDILMRRSHVSYRFYVIVFAAELYYTSSISRLLAEFHERFARKLR